MGLSNCEDRVILAWYV